MNQQTYVVDPRFLSGDDDAEEFTPITPNDYQSLSSVWSYKVGDKFETKINQQNFSGVVLGFDKHSGQGRSMFVCSNSRKHFYIWIDFFTQ